MKIFFDYSLLRTNKKQLVNNKSKQSFNFKADSPLNKDVYTMENFDQQFQRQYGEWLKKCKPETEFMSGGKVLEVYRNKDGFPIKEIYMDVKKQATQIFEHLYDGRKCVLSKRIK